MWKCGHGRQFVHVLTDLLYVCFYPNFLSFQPIISHLFILHILFKISMPKVYQTNVKCLCQDILTLIKAMHCIKKSETILIIHSCHILYFFNLSNTNKLYFHSNAFIYKIFSVCLASQASESNFTQISVWYNQIRVTSFTTFFMFWIT